MLSLGQLRGYTAREICRMLESYRMNGPDCRHARKTYRDEGSGIGNSLSPCSAFRTAP